MKYPAVVTVLGLLVAVCSAGAAQDEKKAPDRKEPGRPSEIRD